MSTQAIISAAIGLILIIVMIFLVARYAPRRRFPGWRIMLVVVLLAVVGTMIALIFSGSTGVSKP